MHARYQGAYLWRSIYVFGLAPRPKQLLIDGRTTYLKPMPPLLTKTNATPIYAALYHHGFRHSTSSYHKAVFHTSGSVHSAPHRAWPFPEIIYHSCRYMIHQGDPTSCESSRCFLKKRGGGCGEKQREKWEQLLQAPQTREMASETILMWVDLWHSDVWQPFTSPAVQDNWISWNLFFSAFAGTQNFPRSSSAIQTL